MTSYLATIRIEAFGLAEAKEEAAWIADHARGEKPAEVVSVVQEREGVPFPNAVSAGQRVNEWVGGHSWHSLSSEPPGYVTEAIEAAVRQVSDSIGNLRAEVAEALDSPSDLLVERVAKRLAERRLMG